MCVTKEEQKLACQNTGCMREYPVELSYWPRWIPAFGSFGCVHWVVLILLPLVWVWWTCLLYEERMEPASAQHLLPYLAWVVWVMSADNNLVIPSQMCFLCHHKRWWARSAGAALAWWLPCFAFVEGWEKSAPWFSAQCCHLVNRLYVSEACVLQLCRVRWVGHLSVQTTCRVS